MPALRSSKSEVGSPRIYFGISFLVFLSFASPLFAGGNSSLENLLVGLPALPSSMGNAYCGVPGKLEGVYNNPAMIANLDEGTLNISYLKSFLDQYYTSIDFGGMPMNSTSRARNTAFMGVAYFDGGLFEANYADGTTENLRAEQDVVLSCGFGTNIEKGMEKGFYGVNIKAITSTLVGRYTGYALCLDIGIQGKLTENIYGGIACQNLGSSIKYLDTDEKLPQLLRAGIGYVRNRFTASCDANYMINEDHNPLKLNLGTEYLLKFDSDNSADNYLNIALRGGYKLYYDKGRLSAGIGVYLGGNKEGISYAIEDMDGAPFHSISLSLHFDK